MFNHNDKKNSWAKSKVTLGAVALGLTALLLPGCDLATQEDTTVTTEEVSQNPQELAGEQVTVRSLVSEAVGESGFMLERSPGEPVLVINATGETFELPPQDIPIQATGIVTELVIADVESLYGIILEEDLYIDYENQPAIIAQSLALAPNPGNLVERPNDYFEEAIAVEGELRELDDTPNAFALFEEGWIDDYGVLVIGVEEGVYEDLKARGTPVEDAGNVTVTGMAREFSAELVQEAGLGWTPEQIAEFERRYTERPVIVADGVYPSAQSPVPGS